MVFSLIHDQIIILKLFIMNGGNEHFTEISDNVDLTMKN